MNTREHYKSLLPVIQAYAEGRDVQFKSCNTMWSDYDGRGTPAFTSECLKWRIKPEKQVQYINIYAAGSYGHPTRQEADNRWSATRLACIRIEYERDQYDD